MFGGAGNTAVSNNSRSAAAAILTAAKNNTPVNNARTNTATRPSPTSNSGTSLVNSLINGASSIISSVVSNVFSSVAKTVIETVNTIVPKVTITPTVSTVDLAIATQKVMPYDLGQNILSRLMSRNIESKDLSILGTLYDRVQGLCNKAKMAIENQDQNNFDLYNLFGYESPITIDTEASNDSVSNNYDPWARYDFTDATLNSTNFSDEYTYPDDFGKESVLVENERGSIVINRNDSKLVFLDFSYERSGSEYDISSKGIEPSSGIGLSWALIDYEESKTLLDVDYKFTDNFSFNGKIVNVKSEFSLMKVTDDEFIIVSTAAGVNIVEDTLTLRIPFSTSCDIDLSAGASYGLSVEAVLSSSKARLGVAVGPGFILEGEMVCDQKAGLIAGSYPYFSDLRFYSSKEKDEINISTNENESERDYNDEFAYYYDANQMKFTVIIYEEQPTILTGYNEPFLYP
jgi:hypothetical protein